MIPFFIPVILIVLFISILPVAWSFIPNIEQSNFEIFKNLWFDGSFRISLFVSYSISLLSTFISISFGMRLGFIMFKSNEKIKNILYFLTLFIWLLPYYVIIPFIRMFVDFTNPNFLYNRFFSFILVVLTKAVLDVPMIAFISFAISKGVPESVKDSLIIDGANTNDMFSAVYKEQIKYTLKPYIILLMINGMRDITVPLLLTNGGPMLERGFSIFGSSGITTTFGIFLKTSIDRMESDSFFFVRSALVSSILIFTFLILWLSYGKERIVWIFLSIMEIMWFGWIGLASAAFFLLRFVFKKNILLYTAIILSFLTGLITGYFSPSFLTLISFLILFKWKDENFKPSYTSFSDLMIKNLVIVPWIVICMFIIFILLCASFTDLPDLGFSGLFRLTTIGLTRLKEDKFQINILNSLMIGFGSSMLTTLLIFVSSMGFIDNQHRFSEIVKILLSSTLILTGMNTLIPLFVIFRNLRLLNTYIPVILISVNKSLPMSYFIIAEDIKRLKPFIEQGLLDGASRFPIFIKIIFPLMIPSILVCASFSFIKGWTNFIAPLIFISNPILFPVSVKLFEYAGDPTLQYIDWNSFAIGALITVSLILLLSFTFKGRTYNYSIIE